MSQNAKELISQDKIPLITNFGAHMMMADMELKMAVFLGKKLLIQGESKTLSASMGTNTKL